MAEHILTLPELWASFYPYLPFPCVGIWMHLHIEGELPLWRGHPGAELVLIVCRSFYGDPED